MANILDRYGIKEVADVVFYELDDNGRPSNPALYLDTLKVSTIEQTAEEAEARGGKGNPPLIIWDYGKEITVTLEDALFSAKSMAIMFGNGKVKDYHGNIMKTEQFIAEALVAPKEGSIALPTSEVSGGGWSNYYEAPDGKRYKKLNPKFYDANGNVVAVEAAAATETTPKKVAWKAGEKYFCSYDLEALGAVIEISATSFPGTYYVVGDTFARSEASGKDEFFQFIIEKAKVQSENTITLEAEGDPSVFNMNLRVLRPASGKMMRLVKYDLCYPADAKAEEAVVLIHNHTLLGTNDGVAINEGFNEDGTPKHAQG